jgi:hypothetical protein
MFVGLEFLSKPLQMISSLQPMNRVSLTQSWTEQIAEPDSFESGSAHKKNRIRIMKY